MAALLVGLAVPAAAQIPAGQAVPPGSPLPRVLPPAPPAVAPPLPAVPQPALPAAPNAVLQITAVRVEGVTAYPAGTFDPQVAGLTGPAVPIGRIDAARQAILQRYRGDGYVLSTVTARIDASGVLHFVITEGRIASVKLSQDIGPAGVQVLRFLERLTEQRPIDEATLERYLLLAQDVPGITLHAVLQPSADEPGALNLIAEVSRRPVTGLFTTDNYASTFTGPGESLAVVNLNSFTEFGEQTQISLYHTWPESQTFGQASVEGFVGGSGLKLRLYGGDGETTPTGIERASGYFGVTRVVGAQASYPLIRARVQTLNLVANFDALESDIVTTGARSFDSLRVLRAGADYARSDILLGGGRPAVNAITVRLSQGLPALGASPNGSPTLPRTGERVDFFKVAAQISRTQTLFAPWQDATVAVEGLLAGQVSPHVLPPEEEFYLGGLQLNRGYYSGEVSGDKALAATIELQLNTSFDLSFVGLAEPVPAQFYAFYDWGEVWQNDRPALQPRIASTGGGVRLTATQYAEIDLLGLARLNRFPTGTGANVAPLHAGTFLWRVVGRF